jgi:hypothetical protein
MYHSGMNNVPDVKRNFPGFPVLPEIHIGVDHFSSTGQAKCKTVKHLGVNFSFLLHESTGEQLNQIGILVESGVIRPVLDKLFLFEQTNEAMS